MYRSNLFDNPIAIFLLFCLSGLFNIILPVHFISIFLVGVLFMAFIRCLDKGYTYSMLLLVVGFTIFELSHGLKIFSVSLVAFLFMFLSHLELNLLLLHKPFIFYWWFYFYILVLGYYFILWVALNQN